MARISTYSIDSTVTDSDFLIGADGDNSNVTKRFQMSVLKTYFSTNEAAGTTFTGAIVPNADDSLDIGTSSVQWQDIYIDGIAYVDQLGTDSDPSTVYIGGGEIDSTVIGGETPAAATFTDLSITGDLNMDGSSGVAGYYLQSQGDGVTPIWDQITLNDLGDIEISTDSIYIGNEPSANNSGSYNIGIGTATLDAITTGDNLVGLGYEALTLNTTGGNSTALGAYALNALVSSDDATAVGYQALFSNTVAGNTAVGSGASKANILGIHNVAVGFNTLFVGDNGSYNTAIGSQALYSVNPSGTSATSTYNTAVGSQAGYAVTTGVKNTLIGSLAGDAVTTGSFNTVLGYESLSQAVLPSYNTAIGASALAQNVNGSENIAIGYRALTAMNPASAVDTFNIAIGNNAGKTVTTGISNIFIGQNAGLIAQATNYNIAIGTAALSHDVLGSGSVAIGYQALEEQVPAGSGTIGNTAVGYQAGKAMTTGGINTFIGASAGKANTTGSANTAIGSNSLGINITGGGNTAVGEKALALENAGSLSTAVGVGSLYAQVNSGATDVYNTATGHHSGFNTTTGKQNTFIGGTAAHGNTIGDDNVAIGMGAMYVSDEASNCVAIGYRALYSQNPASAVDMFNVAIGHSAGGMTTGIKNTIIGGIAGTTTTGSKVVCIGYDAQPSANTTDNEIVIGTDANGLGANSTIIGNDATIKAEIKGLRSKVTAITSNTTLTANNSGQTLVFNDADGAVITLPDSGAGDLTGVYFNFFIAVTVTSNSHKIACADTTNEKLLGSLHAIDEDGDASAAIWNAQASDNFSAITTTGVTKGKIGTHITITNMAADVWHVRGELVASGTPATPFATS